MDLRIRKFLLAPGLWFARHRKPWTWGRTRRRKAVYAKLCGSCKETLDEAARSQQVRSYSVMFWMLVVIFVLFASIIFAAYTA